MTPPCPRRPRTEAVQALSAAARTYVQKHGRWPVRAILDLDFWESPGDTIVVQDVIVTPKFRRLDFTKGTTYVEHKLEVSAGYELGPDVVGLQHERSSEDFHIFNVTR